MSQSVQGHVEYKEFEYSYFGRVSLAADDILLALLGGEPLQKPTPCFVPRVLPADISPLTSRAYYLVVTDSEPLRDRFISRQEANEWVAGGASLSSGSAEITDPVF